MSFPAVRGQVRHPHIRFLAACLVLFSAFYGFSATDAALALLTVAMMPVRFEALLFILLAYLGQLFMMHSCNPVGFIVSLEAQTLCVVVLCGLLARGVNTFSVEAALKFLLLSAMVSGAALFWFSAIYQRTGGVTLATAMTHFWITLVMLFKLGVAPVHMWSVDLYGSIPNRLLMYLSTAPKLSLLTFWASSWHFSGPHDWRTIAFIVFSMAIGSLGAYGQPALRGLFAYSTVYEIGLMLLAIETAGFHSLYQHLAIYMVTQVLLWNHTRLFALCAVSLAGLPPFAGFFGKAWIFWHAMSVGALSAMAAAVLFTVLSLVYYLRVIRLWSLNYTPMPVIVASLRCPASSVAEPAKTAKPLLAMPASPAQRAASVKGVAMGSIDSKGTFLSECSHSTLTSILAVALLFMPIMLVKPFII